MSFGIQVLDSSGGVLLDSSLNAGRLIDVFDVTSGSSGTETDTRYSGCVVMAVALAANSAAILPHAVSISGDTVTYTAVLSSYASRIFVIGKTS